MKINKIGNNQTEIIYSNNLKILFSYETPVVAEFCNELIVTEQKYSRTTSKHIKQYVNGRSHCFQKQQFFNELVGENE